MRLAKYLVVYYITMVDQIRKSPDDLVSARIDCHLYGGGKFSSYLKDVILQLRASNTTRGSWINMDDGPLSYLRQILLLYGQVIPLPD